MRLLSVSAVVLALLLSAPMASRVSAQNQSKPAPQDEFVPIEQLPQQEELPAAPIVVAAYSVVWVAFLVYVISLVKRVRRVETDLVALERERR
jgi:CcmD family protein